MGSNAVGIFFINDSDVIFRRLCPGNEWHLIRIGDGHRNETFQSWKESGRAEQKRRKLKRVFLFLSRTSRVAWTPKETEVTANYSVGWLHEGTRILIFLFPSPSHPSHASPLSFPSTPSSSSLSSLYFLGKFFFLFSLSERFARFVRSELQRCEAKKKKKVFIKIWNFFNIYFRPLFLRKDLPVRLEIRDFSNF